MKIFKCEWLLFLELAWKWLPVNCLAYNKALRFREQNNNIVQTYWSMKKKYFHKSFLLAMYYSHVSPHPHTQITRNCHFKFRCEFPIIPTPAKYQFHHKKIKCDLCTCSYMCIPSEMGWNTWLYVTRFYKLPLSYLLVLTLKDQLSQKGGEVVVLFFKICTLRSHSPSLKNTGARVPFVPV